MTICLHSKPQSQITRLKSPNPLTSSPRAKVSHHDKVLVTISVIDDKGINQPVRQAQAALPLGRKLDARVMDDALKDALKKLLDRPSK